VKHDPRSFAAGKTKHGGSVYIWRPPYIHRTCAFLSKNDQEKNVRYSQLVVVKRDNFFIFFEARRFFPAQICLCGGRLSETRSAFGETSPTGGLSVISYQFLRGKGDKKRHFSEKCRPERIYPEYHRRSRRGQKNRLFS